MRNVFTLCFAITLCSYMSAGNANVELTGLNMKGTQVINQNVAISGTVTNSGTETIHSFDVQWTDGSITHSQTISGLDMLPGETYTFTHNTSFTPAEARKYDISVSVLNPNGEIGIDATHGTMSTSVYGLLRSTTKRTVAEEATGTWCGWCVRGIVFMDQMRAEYPDTFIGIAVHDGDPMTITAYDNAVNNYITGYPSVLLDRITTIDPSALPTQVPTHLDDDPIADLHVYGTYDDVSRTLSVDVHANFETDMSDLNYRLNLIVTEDSVTGTSSGYNQENYYAGGGSGAMGGFESMPGLIPAADMSYQFVARKIYDGWDGTENSVPTSVYAGQDVFYHYEFILPAIWNVNNLNVIGIMSDFNSPRNKILNGYSTKIAALTTYTGINTVQNDNYNIELYPNPSVSQSYITMDLTTSQDVKITVTDLMGNVVAERDYGQESGNIVLPVNTGNFASGLYSVSVLAGTSMTTKQLEVVH